MVDIEGLLVVGPKSPILWQNLTARTIVERLLSPAPL